MSDPFSARAVIDSACPGALRLRTELASYAPIGIDLGRRHIDLTLPTLAWGGVCLLGQRSSDLALIEPQIVRLRAALPHMHIIVLADLDRTLAVNIPAYVEAGVDDVVFTHGEQLVEGTAQSLLRRLRAPAPEQEIRSLSGAWPDSRAKVLALSYVRNAVARGFTQNETERFALTRRHIGALLRDAGIPAPGILVRAGRVFHAQQLRRQGCHDAAQIARRLGFGSADAVRLARWRLLRRLSRVRTAGRLRDLISV
jgi:hypothetical protein